MSRYEILRAELAGLRIRQAIALMAPTAAIVALSVHVSVTDAMGPIAGLASLILLPLLFHRVWQIMFPTYRGWVERSSQVTADIAALRRRIAAIFEKYRERGKGERFKRAYDLAGRPVRELEEALSVGMYRERREVFVTAFMRGGIAVRVTASIGSPFRCSASDNPAGWNDHFDRLGCDEIRQYHNHPVHNGSTRPSATDVRTSQLLKAVLEPYGVKLRSLIICWNSLQEWKVFEHDDGGRHWLHFEFDAAA